MRLTLSGLVDSSPWLDVVNDSDGVCDWFTLSDMLSGADSTDVDDCCWRDAAWFSDLRFSQMFSFGGGAGTSLTGAGFSADGFFVTFLTDSTSWSPSSSTSFETDLDPSDHQTRTHKHTHRSAWPRFVNGPWNNLPSSFQLSDLLPLFKWQLTTYLFQKSLISVSLIFWTISFVTVYSDSGTVQKWSNLPS